MFDLCTVVRETGKCMMTILPQSDNGKIRPSYTTSEEGLVKITYIWKQQEFNFHLW